MKKILLVGDSWAWCWFDPKFFKSKSFKKFLMLKSPKSTHPDKIPMMKIMFESMGFMVDSLAVPGGSNFCTLNEMKKYVSRKPPPNTELIDYVIILHAEVFRQIGHTIESDFQKYGIRNYDNYKIAFKDLTPVELQEKADQYASDFYQSLTNVVNDHFSNSKVFVLGSSGKVKTDLLDKFKSKNIECICPSIYEYLFRNIPKEYEDLPEFVHHDFANNLWLSQVDMDWKPETIEFLDSVSNDLTNYKNMVGPPARMWLDPDEGHMNANGHFAIIDLIMKHIEESEKNEKK